MPAEAAEIRRFGRRSVRQRSPAEDGAPAGFVGPLLALLLCFFLAAPPVAAQSLDIASVQAGIAELESSDALDPAQRDAALALYRRAQNELERSAAFESRARSYEQARTEAPQQQALIRQRLQEPAPADIGISFDADVPISEIEQQLALERAQRDADAQALERIGDELIAQRQRPAEAQRRLVEAAAEQRELAGNLAAAPPPDLADPVAVARQVADRAHLDALDAEIRMLEQELLSQPVRVALLEARRDEITRELTRSRARVEAVRAALTERRRVEIARTFSESEGLGLDAGSGVPEIRRLVEGNAELGNELSGLTEDVQHTSRQRAEAQHELESLRRRFESAREKVEVAGLSPALGRFLAAEQRELPSSAEYGRASRDREKRIADAGLRGLQLDEDLEFWEATDARRSELIEALPSDAAELSRDALDGLIRARADLVRQLISVNKDFLGAVTELELVEQQLRRATEEFRNFLSSELLWVRNESVLTPAKLLSLPEELASALSPGRWAEALRVLARQSLTSPVQIVAWLIVLVGIWMRSRLALLLKLSAAKVGKPSEDRFEATLQAMGLTLALAAPWPLFVLLTGSQLIHGDAAGPDSAAIGWALVQVAPLLFLLLVVRWICHRDGVAALHFRWNADGLVRLRRELGLLNLTLLVPSFVLLVSLRFLERDASVALTQTLFLVIVVGVFRFLRQLLTPHTGILEGLRRRARDRPLLRLPWLWLVAALAVPVALGVVAISGFMYSAGMLLDRLMVTLLLVLGLVLVHGLIERWLLVIRRRLLLREALARREAVHQSDGASDAAEAPGAAMPGEPAVDVASLDADSRTLVNVALSIGGLIGIAAIWAPALPALFTLDGIGLWEYTQSIDGVDTLRRVTAADVLVAVLIAALTFAAARSLPALVEIVLRHRRVAASGSRLAFATLTRYGIVLIGLGLALSMIGINWSKLQWLVAALGVGIGFGLQEIVANFISGLIILIERPVRVGDVVTVGDASGTVTRIRIRATTIRNWDEQELIVPNKEFITARVVNWSLSDEVTRIFFIVGIAYGSETEKALGLIRDAALEHPAVLDEPPPMVTFESFGDNTLNLGLRCYVSAIGERLSVRTDLHLAIDRKLREAGIVIAFPQRDVHLDTSRPLDIRMVGPVGDESG